MRFIPAEIIEQQPLLPYHIAAPQVNFHWGRCFQYIKIEKVLSGLLLISGGVYIECNPSYTFPGARVVSLVMIIVGSRFLSNEFFNAIGHHGEHLIV